MRIDQIDKNFKFNNSKINGQLIKVPSESVSLFGLKYDDEKGFYRLPIDIANETNEGVAFLNFHTAGGRVAFETDSNVISIHVSWTSLDKMYHMPLTGQAGFVLNKVQNNKETHVHTFGFDFSADNGFSSTTNKLPGKGMRKYILYFPLYNRVQHLYIEIKKGKTIKPFKPYCALKPILYYGSSITQGGCASRGDNSYQSFISKWTNIDHINLGFSGNAKGEQIIADYLSKIPCSIFVMDYDHNAPTVEHLSKTHENLFLTFRKANPETTVIMLSAPNYSQDPKTYSKRRKIVKQTYLNALNKGDKNVYFIDGNSIFPKQVNTDCTVDGCHPNDLGFYFMAKKLYILIRKIMKNY